jgi:chromatin remodeling complex protein RSC6
MDDTDDYSKLVEQLETMRKTISTMVSSVKHLQKQHAKHAKRLHNVKSGFMKPVPISEPLRRFIQTDENELVARCVVNKRINDYIKLNNLQQVENKQQFVVDDSLSTVFEVDVGTVIHYFKMQTYLKHHYPKQTSV